MILYADRHDGNISEEVTLLARACRFRHAVTSYYYISECYRCWVMAGPPPFFHAWPRLGSMIICFSEGMIRLRISEAQEAPFRYGAHQMILDEILLSYYYDD